MTDLSDLGKQQREELVDDVRDALSDACDMDVTFGMYAEAVVRMLEKRGLVHFQGAKCPSCGRDLAEAESGSCMMGGCPCGGDL